MEVALILGLFISTALSLNCLVGQKHKLSGMFDVISLCLVVAVAYQFDQVKNIIWVLAVVAAVIIVFFLFKTYFKKTKEKKHIVEAEYIEEKKED